MTYSLVATAERLLADVRTHLGRVPDGSLLINDQEAFNASDLPKMPEFCRTHAVAFQLSMWTPRGALYFLATFGGRGEFRMSQSFVQDQGDERVPTRGVSHAEALSRDPALGQRRQIQGVRQVDGPRLEQERENEDGSQPAATGRGV